MRRLLALVLVTGCAGMEETVRTERGPLLRTFERPRIVEGGVSGQLSVQWPKATLKIEGYDTCRTEKVEEYAEDKIHEHRGTGAGASLSAGVVMNVAAAVLLGASFALSGQPNMTRIDGAGNYGAPPRFIARGWSIGLFCIGVPALAVGIVQMLRTGEEIETVKIEQLASQRDETCNVHAVDGPVYLRAENGTAHGPLTSKGGVVEFDTATAGTVIDAFFFYEREVVLDDASETLLAAFNGCSRLEREQASAAEAMTTGQLLKRFESARACRQLRGDAIAAELSRLEVEVGRRREGGEAGAFPAGARRLSSFAEAVSAYPPRATLEDGSADRGMSLDTLIGQSVLVRGRVQGGLSPNIGVVSYADREVFVFLPPDAPWAGEDFPLGTTVELIGLVQGQQTVGERTAPLIRAVWMGKVSAK